MKTKTQHLLDFYVSCGMPAEYLTKAQAIELLTNNHYYDEDGKRVTVYCENPYLNKVAYLMKQKFGIAWALHDIEKDKDIPLDPEYEFYELKSVIGS